MSAGRRIGVVGVGEGEAYRRVGVGEKRVGGSAYRRVGVGEEERRVGVSAPGEERNLRSAKGSDTKAEKGIVRSKIVL